jgi:hypothetical protein
VEVKQWKKKRKPFLFIYNVYDTICAGSCFYIPGKTYMANDELMLDAL